MSKPRIIVTNRDQIEMHKIELTQPYVVISVSCPGDQATPNVNKHCMATLWIEVDDLEKELINFGDKSFKLFSKDDAKRVLEFYREWKDKAERFIVHCDVGISRSPAIAAALYRVEYRDDSNWFKHYHPNRRIYSSILSEHFLGDSNET